MKLEKVNAITIPKDSFKKLLETVIEKKGELIFKAKGSSMSPFILNGDLVTICPYSDKAPKLGDIVAFTENVTGNLLIHRILLKKDNFFFIKGDNRLKSNGFIHRNAVMGYVKRVEHKNRNRIIGIEKGNKVVALLLNNLLFNNVFILVNRIVNYVIYFKKQ